VFGIDSVSVVFVVVHCFIF